MREGYFYVLGAVLVLLLLYIFYSPTAAARDGNNQTLKYGLTLFFGLAGVGGYNLWQWLGGEPYHKDTSTDDYD